jgi:hypothetical protein
MSFSAEVLDEVRARMEVRIETRRNADAPVHRTIIWIVVDDRDRVLVRSWLGERGRWYREVLVNPECVLWLGDQAIPVHAEPATDPERLAAASAGLSNKYARSSSLPSMLAPHVLPTTLELRPR